MKRRCGANRRLCAESLESRQLLHGGALAAEPPPPAECAENAFTQFDTNEDAMLTQDEVSEQVWERISLADADEDAAISTEELTTHLETLAAERTENGRRGGHRGDRAGRPYEGERLTQEERLDNFFADNDGNEDGLITAEEVADGLWEQLSEADLNEDGVSRDEFAALQEALRQERFDESFARLDANEDGGVTEEEVSERKWSHISAADADGDGNVTSQELLNYVEAQRAEHETDEEADGDMDGDGKSDTDEGGEAVAVGQANANRPRVVRGDRGRGRR